MTNDESVGVIADTYSMLMKTTVYQSIYPALKQHFEALLREQLARAQSKEPVCQLKHYEFTVHRNSHEPL